MFVQVFVPNVYKNVMAGMCGNYNGDPDDDFIGCDGVNYALDADDQVGNSCKTDPT